MDPQVSGLRQRFKANRFASTLVILATLSLGILIGTVVSGAVKGKEQNSSPTLPAEGSLPGSDVQPVLDHRSPARAVVVNINTESTIKNPHRRMGPGQGGQGQDEARAAVTRTIPSRISLTASSADKVDKAAEEDRAATCASARWAPA